jgi:hypothetical protein
MGVYVLYGLGVGFFWGCWSRWYFEGDVGCVGVGLWFGVIVWGVLECFFLVVERSQVCVLFLSCLYCLVCLLSIGLWVDGVEGCCCTGGGWNGLVV